ncbi:hypothetical protein V2J09_014326 [Rumex salicifolius]
MSATAAATAAVGASFATATYTVKRTYTTVRISFRRTPNTLINSPLVSQCYSSFYLPQRRRALRIAAVAEEEAVEAVEAVPVEIEAAVEDGEVEPEAGTVVEDVEAAAEDGEVETAAEAETEEVQVNTKLYFGNLPYHCDSAQLAGIVQQYGTPELVEVLYDRNSGKSRGFAFVTMSNVNDANAVIENLDGSEYAGRYMRVNFADKPKASKPLFPETEHKLFVGNLSWEATSESLHQIFQQCGNVVGARVLYDGETGRSRGYGFVCFGTRQELENALVTLNGEELEGRAMRVSIAEGKK